MMMMMIMAVVLNERTISTFRHKILHWHGLTRFSLAEEYCRALSIGSLPPSSLITPVNGFCRGATCLSFGASKPNQTHRESVSIPNQYTLWQDMIICPSPYRDFPKGGLVTLGLALQLSYYRVTALTHMRVHTLHLAAWDASSNHNG